MLTMTTAEKELYLSQHPPVPRHPTRHCSKCRWRIRDHEGPLDHEGGKCSSPQNPGVFSRCDVLTNGVFQWVHRDGRDALDGKETQGVQNVWIGGEDVWCGRGHKWFEQNEREDGT